MTYKVGPKGQVVLPKPVRERLGIRPGDEVEVSDDGEEVAIRKAISTRPPRGILADPGDPEPLTRTLEAEHRWEMARDEVRIEEWHLRDLERSARGDRP